MTTPAMRPQRTIAHEVGVRGVGFLKGSDVHVRFQPAETDTGVVFIRTDLPGQPKVPAHVNAVVPRERRTTIQQGEATVEMVEHLLAALAGSRIDNCMVEIDAPETPGGDGSSLLFFEALSQAGAVEQDRPREVLVIDRPVSVREGRASLTASPGGLDQLVLSYHLDYGRNNPIGRQSYFLEVTPCSFENELVGSRTFLLADEAEAMRAEGIGSRTTEADLLIFGPDGIIGNELRYPDECARHKVLDMVGDFALAGKDIVGQIDAHRSGHQLNTALVRELLKAECHHKPDPIFNEKSFMDVGAIMKILPHRYPFLLIDRVVEFEAGKRVLALKNVTCNEPFFPGHWPNRPIMPGVLILEALAQTAGILIGHEVDPQKYMAVLASIDNVKLRRPVEPGDQLWLKVENFRTRSRLVDAVATARVADQIVTEARFRFVLVPEVSAA